MQNSSPKKNVFNKALVLLLTFFLVFCSLPVNVFGIDHITETQAQNRKKTVTVYAVKRGTDGKTQDKVLIEPVKVTVYEGTSLRYMLDDLTQTTTEYNNSNKYLVKLKGEYDHNCWRGFIRNGQGEPKGEKALRDLNISDGDQIIITNLDKYNSPLELPSLPITWEQMEPENITNTIDLTEGVETAIDKVSMENMLNGNQADAVTKNLVFDPYITVEGKRYHATWNTSNLDVVDSHGKITRPRTGNDADVKITLALRDGPVKIYNIKVKSYTKDESAVLDVKDKIGWTLIRGENQNGTTANVYMDLVLPETFEGYDGLTVKWKSSNPNVVADNGKVTRPAKDTRNITLTATIKKGQITDTKVVKLNVVFAVTTYEKNLDADVQWLNSTWKAENIKETGLTKDLTMPLKGIKGSTITWKSSDETVVSNKGEIYRDKSGGNVKNTTITATLSAGSWNQKFSKTVKFDVKVLPWDKDSQNLIDAKVKELEDLIAGLKLPENIGVKNQEEVTKTVVDNREKIKSAYNAVINAGLKEKDVQALPAYKKYMNAEEQLRKLPKTVTVSIFDVVKNGNKDYSVDGTYYLPKTKVKIDGLGGRQVNSISKIHLGLKKSGILDDKSWIQITKGKDVIKADNPYEWHCFVNGKDRGIFSGTGSAEKMALEHGDSLAFMYVDKNAGTTITEEQARPLDSSAPVEYDYNQELLADLNWLTAEVILNGNSSRFDIRTDVKLPERGKNGCKITWQSDREDVITKEGKVLRPGVDSSDAVVILKAELTGFNSDKRTKELKLTVPAMKMSPDEKRVSIAKEKLELSGLEAVSKDLKLPTQGFDGAVITWDSNNKAVIDNSGKVTRSKEKDVDVTLIATIKSGEVQVTKKFKAHVLKNITTDREIVAYDAENLNFDAIKAENLSEKKVKKNLRLPDKGVMGSEITWKSSNEKVISVDGIVKQNDKDNNVDLTATIMSGSEKIDIVFHLTVVKLTDKETVLHDALNKIKAVPDAVYVTRENADSVRKKVNEAKVAVAKAKSEGYKEEELTDVSKLSDVEKKLKNLPVAVTYSVVGAEVKNQVIQKYKWFVKPCKLLVPSDVNMSDVTQAMIRNYPAVIKDSGAGYYGSMYGLSEFDAGKGSGWVFGGTKVDVNQAAVASKVQEGAAICWAYIGDVTDSSVEKETLMSKGIMPLPADSPIDKNLVPVVEKTELRNLISKAENLNKSDYRDYGVWAGAWENMQNALSIAKKVNQADTAINYEILDAEKNLRTSINGLEPNTTDKTELINLVNQVESYDSKDYHKDGWDYMQSVLVAAKSVVEDPYADRKAINLTLAELQLAIKNLIPADQADKAELIEALELCRQLDCSEYTIDSWNRFIAVKEKTQLVLDNAKATDEEVSNAVNAINKERKTLKVYDSGALKDISKTVYNVINEYKGTSEPWKIMDMVAAGHGHEVNEKAYLVKVEELLANRNKKAIPTDIEKATIILASLGYDATDITMPDNTVRNLVKEISEFVPAEIDVNALIWGLTAFNSGDYHVEKSVTDGYINELLASQNKDGGWPVYRKDKSDLDMTAMAISALAPYRGEARVKVAIDKGFELLSANKAKICSSPSAFGGNCNTTAMAIIGCSAVPENHNAKTILDAMSIGGLYYYITSSGHFGYMNTLTDNALATEQAVRAFTALSRYIDTNRAVNIYHFGSPEKKLALTEAEAPVIKTDLVNHTTDSPLLRFEALAETADGEKADVVVTVNKNRLVDNNNSYNVTLEYGANYITIEVTGKNGAVSKAEYIVYLNNKMETDTIKVFFTLLGDDKHGDEGKIHTLTDGGLKQWIAETEVTVPANAKVAEVMAKISAEKGYVFNGLSDNWVDSVTTPDGLKLGNFDNGKNSGWMYTLNGGYPALGVGEQSLKDGDKIIFHYTDDYTREKNSDKWNKAEAEKVDHLIEAIGKVTLEKEPQISEARDAYDALAEEAQKLVKNLSVLIEAEAELNRIKGEDSHKTPEDRIGEYREIYNEVGKVYAKHPAAYGSEWIILGMSRGGYPVDKSYYDEYYNSVEKKLSESNGILSEKEYAKYSKTIIGLTASGYNPQNVSGYNLINKLSDLENVQYQGFNGPIWALIALDSNKYKLNSEASTTREALVNEILSKELPGGGWTYTGTKADVDMTAMAMQALAPYYKADDKVKGAVDRGLEFLSDSQTKKAGFRAYGGQECSESTAQVIVALTALGIDPQKDARFIKNGRTMLEALCDFYVDDGRFTHLYGGLSDGIATEQAFYALAAYLRFYDGKTSLYDMSDVEKKEEPKEPEGTGQVPPVIGNKDNAMVTEAGKAKAPKTGDANSIYPWILMLMGAVTSVCVLSRKTKRRER